MTKKDIVIVGGGCAGIACAELLQRSGKSVLLVEKNKKFLSGSSGDMHGWFHTGALYAALPNPVFYKTLIGNLDDLFSYYSNFSNMNLLISKYIYQNNLDGWFNNNLNLYMYAKVSFRYKFIWNLLVKLAKLRLENFEKLDFTRDLSSQTKSIKLLSSNSTVYPDIIIDNQDNTIKRTFITKDRTLNSICIINDLLSSFISNGGEYLLNTDYANIDNSIKYNILINAVGRDSQISYVKNIKSQLLVVYPSLSNFNFIKMTPTVKNSINHIHHSIGDLNYSVLGNGRYFSGNASDIPPYQDITEDCKVLFGNLLDHKYRTYLGVKTEVIKNSMLRNYQYNIIQESHNTYSVFPGKFSLMFSLAVSICKRLGIDPVKNCSYKPQDLTSIISTPKHQDIAIELSKL